MAHAGHYRILHPFQLRSTQGMRLLGTGMSQAAEINIREHDLRLLRNVPLSH